MENDVACNPYLEELDITIEPSSDLQKIVDSIRKGTDEFEAADDEIKVAASRMYLENIGLKPTSLTKILNTTFSEPVWVIPKILPQGVYLFGGKPKMGKSWICLGMSIAVGCGGRVFEQIEVEQGKALYLALEDNERRIKKRTKLMLHDESPSENTEIITKWPRMGEGGTRALRAYLRCNPNTRLVIIDTLAKFRPHVKANENPYMADYKVGDALLPVAHEFNVCILIVTHLRKQASEEDVMDEISGTTGLTGAVDGMLALKRERGEADASLHIDGRDIEEPGEYALKWDATLCQWEMLGNAEEYRMDAHRRSIIYHLKNEPMTIAELAETMGVKKENIRQVVYRMRDEGVIKALPKKRGNATVYAVPEYLPEEDP